MGCTRKQLVMAVINLLVHINSLPLNLVILCRICASSPTSPASASVVEALQKLDKNLPKMDAPESKGIKVLGGVNTITKTDTELLISYATGEQAKLNILNHHVFKFFMSPTGNFPEYPKPNNPEDTAKMISKKVEDYDIKPFQESILQELENSFIVHTDKIKIMFDKKLGTMSVIDKRSEKLVFVEVQPLSYEDNKSVQVLKQHEGEFYFGGGMQNGRFTHKGKLIDIENTNDWVDGGVTSPCPFYWSSYGYGIMRNTWQPGKYDFGTESLDTVKTTHMDQGFDAFFFISEEPKDLLKDYFELTGQPIFMPEYAFYEAHLNAFNRDYWVKVSPDTAGAILFEDGEYYKSYQPSQMGDKVGILESLNGEKDNYQFSARAMIDRYKLHDLPLAWFVPNDGYGSGYGQTGSLDGDIQNLKEFGDYARSHGVEIAVWTESQLEPEDPLNPKKGERDLRKEVSVAGVAALKCDVAWIGEGYSFGFNAVEKAANVFSSVSKARTMIIMVDGWAGTQRHAGIWSGDQKGGEWEYIRFHIPTYIGSGLSGMPVIGSDMDGIYTGKLKEVNIRDFQWKTFTPLQLNMDGWGRIQKTPFSFDKESTSINRAYLKLKSMMMPYNYNIGHESIKGLPMVRAMFLEFPKETLGYTDDSKYQFMWGPSVLVAPIYDQRGFIDGSSLRNGIYLPDSSQVWIDLFTGEKFQGGKVLNNIRVPLWKIPVFVKDGAIIPLTNPNNNPYEIQKDSRIFLLYPNDEKSFHLYEDDGKSYDYLQGKSAMTKIELLGPVTNEQGDLFINIHKTEGSYDKMVKERSTELRIMASNEVEEIKAAVNGESIELNKLETAEDFQKSTNVFYFDENFEINPYLNEASNEKYTQKFLLVKIDKLDVTTSHIQLKVKYFENKGKIFGANNKEIDTLNPPNDFDVREAVNNSVTLQWKEDTKASYYEIQRNETIFSNMIGNTFTFDNLQYEKVYTFKIRSVNSEGVSKWGSEKHIKTQEDPRKHVIKGVKVSCNYPCQNNHEVRNLTDGKPSTMWHTKFDTPRKENDEDIVLTFDLGGVFLVDKMEYVPRNDGGLNGNILEIKYKYSEDGKSWSTEKETKFRDDSFIRFEGARIRFVELTLKHTYNDFGSGKHVNFYKKVE